MRSEVIKNRKTNKMIGRKSGKPLSDPVVTNSKLMKSRLIFKLFESLRTGNKQKSECK